MMGVSLFLPLDLMLPKSILCYPIPCFLVILGSLGKYMMWMAFTKLIGISVHKFGL